jgi:hypothetical protein
MITKIKIPFLICVCSFSLLLADVISGVVTDPATNTGIAGVKVSLFKSSVYTTTGSDGSYTLNTSGTTAINVIESALMLNSIWDCAKGIFRWDRNFGNVSIEVRSLSGKRIDIYDSRVSSTPFSYEYPRTAAGVNLVSVSTKTATYLFRVIRIAGQPAIATVIAESGSISPRAIERDIAQTGTVRYLWYEKESYVRQVMEVQGSKSGVNVTMKKFDISTKTWRKARLTWYTSWPEPGSSEWEDYNGGAYCGMFAAISGKKPETWVAAHNIAAVHSKDFNTMKLKTLRLKMSSKQIDAQVLDYCSDSDCSGCCTRNAGSTGYLIDIESYTKSRFGTGDGTVDWTCLDCD